MNNVTITATTDKGEPLSALSRVIESRVRELGESTRNATVATAINVLKSLRSDTRVARDKSVFVSVTEVKNVISSFTTGRRRCLRIGTERGARVTGRRAVYLVGRRLKNVEERVYLVRDKSKSGKRDEDYYIVAHDRTSAEEYAKSRREKRIRRYKGLAKHALGIAMSKISTRNSVSGGIGSHADRVARKNVGALSYANGKSYCIDINDLLRYATGALKSGESGVSAAFRRAANSTIGYINQSLKTRNIRRSLKIPFPEL